MVGSFEPAHICPVVTFAVRDRKQLSLFDADVVEYRWTLDYMKEVCHAKDNSIDDDTFQVCFH